MPLNPRQLDFSVLGQGLNKLFANKEKRQERQFAETKEREQAMFQDSREAIIRLENKDYEGVGKLLQSRIDAMRQHGGNPEDTVEIRNMVNAGQYDQAINTLKMFDKIGVQRGYLSNPLDEQIKQAQLANTTSPRGGNELSAEYNSFLDNIKDMPAVEQTLAKKVRAKVIAAPVGNAAMTIAASDDITKQVAKSGAVIEGAKVGARLAKEYKLKPKIAAAIAYATANVKIAVDDALEKRSNEKTLAIYEIGIKSLADSLGATTTGPFVGIFPALTAKAQTADASIAMMAPLLKEMFRGAGEGTFTDADQKLLMGLIPDRGTQPEAINASMEKIDALIRLRLSKPKEVTIQEKPLSDADMLKLYGDQ